MKTILLLALAACLIALPGATADDVPSTPDCLEDADLCDGDEVYRWGEDEGFWGICTCDPEPQPM